MVVVEKQAVVLAVDVHWIEVKVCDDQFLSVMQLEEWA